jgi:hypothetical protein
VICRHLSSEKGEIPAARRPTRDPYARPAIQTLERLHGELGGKIHESRQEAESLGEQMQHVEAVIKMLEPGYNLARIAIKRRTANPWFKRGTLYRKALDVLRTATDPMTAIDIAQAVLAASKVTDADAKAAVKAVQVLQVLSQGILGDTGQPAES